MLLRKGSLVAFQSIFLGVDEQSGRGRILTASPLLAEGRTTLGECLTNTSGFFIIRLLTLGFQRKYDIR